MQKRKRKRKEKEKEKERKKEILDNLDRQIHSYSQQYQG